MKNISGLSKEDNVPEPVMVNNQSLGKDFPNLLKLYSKLKRYQPNLLQENPDQKEEIEKWMLMNSSTPLREIILPLLPLRVDINKFELKIDNLEIKQSKVDNLIDQKFEGLRKEIVQFFRFYNESQTQLEQKVKELKILKRKKAIYKNLLKRKILDHSRGLKKKIKLIELKERMEAVQDLLKQFDAFHINFFAEIDTDTLESLLSKIEVSIQEDAWDESIEELFYKVYQSELFDVDRLAQLALNYRKCIFLLKHKTLILSEASESKVLFEHLLSKLENVKFQIDVLGVVVLDLLLFSKSLRLKTDTRIFYEKMWKESGESVNVDEFASIVEVLNIKKELNWDASISSVGIKQFVRVLIGYDDEGNQEEGGNPQDISNSMLLSQQNIKGVLECVCECIIGTHLKSDKFLSAFEDDDHDDLKVTSERKESDSRQSRDSVLGSTSKRLLIRIINSLKEIDCEKTILQNVLESYFSKLKNCVRKQGNFESFENFIKLETVLFKNYSTLNDIFSIDSSDFQDVLQSNFEDAFRFIERDFNVKMLYKILKQMKDLDFFSFKQNYTFQEEINSVLKFTNSKRLADPVKFSEQKPIEYILVNGLTKKCLTFLNQSLIFKEVISKDLSQM